MFIPLKYTLYSILTWYMKAMANLKLYLSNTSHTKNYHSEENIKKCVSLNNVEIILFDLRTKTIFVVLQLLPSKMKLYLNQVKNK
jgi:hypothetical protein